MDWFHAASIGAADRRKAGAEVSTQDLWHNVVIGAYSRPSAEGRAMNHAERWRVELTSRIYDCALEPGQWSAVLDEMRSALGFANGLLRFSAVDGGEAAFEAAANVDPTYLACAEEYRDDIPRLWGGNERLSRAPLGIPLVLSQQPEAWRRNRFIREWAAPQGLDDGVTAPLARSGVRFSRIVFAQARRRGDVDQAQTDMLRALAPHMRRALQVAERLAEGDAPGDGSLEGRFSAAPAALFLLDRRRRLLRANAAADGLLAARAPVRLVGGTLTAEPDGDFEAMALGAAQGGFSPAVVLEDDRRAWIARATPVGWADALRRLAPQAVVLVALVAARARPPEGLAADLEQNFGLTPAEARVALHLAEGGDTASAASRFGVSRNTVRVQLAGIMGKLGRHAQRDVVDLVAALAEARRAAAAFSGRD